MFSVYDICSGCGGLSLGLKFAGFKIVGAVDNNKTAVKLYKRNVDNNCIVGNIFNTVIEKDSVDLLVAGLPCQGFSTIGKMDSNDPRNSLWKVFYTLLVESRSSAFIVENVPFFLKTIHFKKFLSSVEQLGFFTNYGIINTFNFGVPQIRKRAFFLGSIHRKPQIPEGNCEPKTVRDAIGDLPLEPNGKNGHIPRQHTKKTLERFKYVPPGGNRFNLPDHLSNPCWKRLKHDGAESSFSRLKWDEPAHTIRTTFLQPECGKYIHPEADRGLTLREGARLQGFEDSYLLDSPIHSKSLCIGNAVPPPLAKAVGELMKDCL